MPAARYRWWPSCCSQTTRSSSAPTCSAAAEPGRSVERIAAGAGAGGVRVVDREALLLDGVDEVDGGALDVGRAHPVDGQRHATEIGGQVAVEGAVVEEQVVAQAGAATRLHGDPQRQVIAALLVEECLGLACGRVGQHRTVGLGGGVVLNSHRILLKYLEEPVHAFALCSTVPCSRAIPELCHSPSLRAPRMSSHVPTGG